MLLTYTRMLEYKKGTGIFGKMIQTGGLGYNFVIALSKYPCRYSCIRYTVHMILRLFREFQTENFGMLRIRRLEELNDTGIN